MDFVYMPEVLAYGPLRNPVYRDYEQPWNRDYFNYGKSSQNTIKEEKIYTQKSRCDQCYLCKQNKRRILGTFIKKNRSNSCNDIEEKEEVIDENEEDGIDEMKNHGEKKIEVIGNKSKFSFVSGRKS